MTGEVAPRSIHLCELSLSGQIVLPGVKEQCLGSQEVWTTAPVQTRTLVSNGMNKACELRRANVSIPRG